MNEKHFRTSLVSDPFFYGIMSNSRCPHTPDEFTFEMKVNVERLRREIIPSQPARRARSIRGQRNPERCDDRPRFVRGRANPEYRELRHQRRRKKFSLSRPVWMFSCTPTLQARSSRSVFCFNQTSEKTTTTKLQLRKYKPALARSLRDCQFADSNEIRLQPSKTSRLTGVVQHGNYYFSEERNVFCMHCFLALPCVLPAFYCCIFPVMSAIFRSRYEG